jgi:hypothetical protein
VRFCLFSGIEKWDLPKGEPKSERGIEDTKCVGAEEETGVNQLRVTKLQKNPITF